MREIEDKLGRAQVIDVDKLSGETVKFGAAITLVDEDTGEEVTYQLVGVDEADVAEGRLSITAPIARAVINKSVGDSVIVETPAGTKGYEIVSVDFR